MYQDFYGLTAKPFSLTPDPEYFYGSSSHANALELVRHGLRQRVGVMTLTGISGAGKTTLCRTILQLGDDTFERSTFMSLVLNPYLTADELLQVVLQDFGVISREEASAGRLAQVSTQDLLRTLHDFLRSLVPLGAAAVLLVDEAQKLSLPMLQQLQRLAGLTENGRPLLQILLVGQLGLKDVLRNPAVAALASQISIRYRLRPLAADETAAYVAHRLQVAGAVEPDLFTSRALHAVHRSSRGNPRLINLMCERALQAGFTEGHPVVDAQLVLRAAAGLGLAPSEGVLSWFRRVAAL
jgi:general secretion pathway protein A